MGRLRRARCVDARASRLLIRRLAELRRERVPAAVDRRIRLRLGLPLT